MTEPLMVELIDGVWVRPDQVQALYKDDSGRFLYVRLQGSDRLCFTLSEADLLCSLDQIVARLAPQRWEQPPADDGTIEIRNGRGEVRRVASSRPTSEYRNPEGEVVWSDTTAKRGGLQWGDRPEQPSDDDALPSGDYVCDPDPKHPGYFICTSRHDGSVHRARLDNEVEAAVKAVSVAMGVRPDAPGDQKLWYRE